MIHNSSRVIIQSSEEKRLMRNKKFKFTIKIRCALEKVISFIESFSQKLIALNGVPLEKNHLLKIPYASMG